MMTAYAKSRRDDAVDKAQSIFDDMVRLHALGDANLAPDTVSYNSVLNALAKSKRAESAEQAEGILRDMWRAWEPSGRQTTRGPTIFPHVSSTQHTPPTKIDEGRS